MSHCASTGVSAMLFVSEESWEIECRTGDAGERMTWAEFGVAGATKRLILSSNISVWEHLGLGQWVPRTYPFRRN